MDFWDNFIKNNTAKSQNEFETITNCYLNMDTLFSFMQNQIRNFLNK